MRITLTIGLTRRQVSVNLGVGLSTLRKWVKVLGEDAVVSGPEQDLARENERLRREHPILKEERDVLKKATAFFASCLKSPIAVTVHGVRAPSAKASVTT